MENPLLNQCLEITKLNKTLESMYTELAELEILGLQYSKEYDKNISYIQMILDVINKKIRALDFTNEDLIEIDEKLGAINGYNDEEHNFILDLFELSENNHMRRLCMQLYYISIENDCGYNIEDIEDKDKYVDSELAENEELQEKCEEYLDELIKKENEVELLKDKLFSHTLMQYLLDAIESEKNIEIKNELIKVKYRLIYLLKDLERRFINNPKKFSRVNFYQELLKEREKDDEEIYMYLYTEPIKEEIEAELNYLSKLNDSYYSNIKNRICVILRVIYIKTYLSMNFDTRIDKELKDIQQQVINETESDISRENVIKSFEIKKELSVPKKVDL